LVVIEQEENKKRQTIASEQLSNHRWLLKRKGKEKEKAAFCILQNTCATIGRG
jgi:hypothetical protein